jgi:hypothetical protein
VAQPVPAVRPVRVEPPECVEQRERAVQPELAARREHGVRQAPGELRESVAQPVPGARQVRVEQRGREVQPELAARPEHAVRQAPGEQPAPVAQPVPREPLAPGAQRDLEGRQAWVRPERLAPRVRRVRRVQPAGVGQRAGAVRQARVARRVPAEPPGRPECEDPPERAGQQGRMERTGRTGRLECAAQRVRAVPPVHAARRARAHAARPV